MDTAATGLIYVGNGQYYDPATGRFLSRGVYPGATNPYVPWQANPAGMIIAPLALLALIRGKRKAGKIDQVLVIAIVVMAVGISVSGCVLPWTTPAIQTPTTTEQQEGTPSTPSTSDANQDPQATQTSTSTSTQAATATQAPTQNTPTPIPCPTPVPTGTPAPSSWQSVGVFNMSAYYITHETQYYFGEGSGSRPIPKLDGISANKYFLFSKEGVCMPGTGRLKDGRLIGCVTQVNWNETEKIDNVHGHWEYIMPLDTPEERDNIPFFFKNEADINFVEAFETVAVCNPGKIPIDKGKKVEVRIKGLKEFVQKYSPKSDEIFQATDTGGALCPNTIDLFIGEEPAYPAFDNVKLQIFPDVMNLPDLEVEMRDMR